MKKSLFAALVLLLACTSIGYAQEEVDIFESLTGYNTYDFDFVGGGARAKGMGNAYFGVSNDINGGTWNPAGIFEIDETIVGISWFNLAPKGNSSTQLNASLVELNHDGSFSDLSSFNFVSPIRVSGHPFVFSLNLNRNFNSFTQVGVQTLDTVYNFSSVTGRFFVDTNEVNTSRTISQEGGMNALSVGFGTRFYNNISFGATINIYTGKSLLFIDENSTGVGFRYNGFQFANFESFSELEDTNKFSGANFTLGFMYNGDKVNAGLVIKTPFELKENRNQNIVSETFIKADSAAAVSLISSGTLYTTDILFKYKMPLMLGVGVGYQVNEKLLLAGDLEYRAFSGKNIDFRISQTINPGGSNFEEYVTLEPEWNNSLSVRLGAEYMSAFSFGNVPLIAGFGYVPTPAPSIDDFGTSSTVVNYSITAGTGIHWEQIKLDLAYVYSTSDTEFGSLNGFQDIKNHVITFSFTGVF